MPYIKNDFPLPPVAYAGFGLTSVIATLLGPILPLLQSQWKLTDQAIGLLFTAQFFGYMLGVLASGQLLERYGGRVCLTVGYCLMAIGPAGLAFGSASIGFAGIACSGLGLGIVDPATNYLVASVSSDRRTTALNALNYVFCTGAVAYPFLILLARHLDCVPASLVGIAVLLSVVAAVLRITPANQVGRPPIDHRDAGVVSGARSFFRSAPKPLAGLFVTFVFLYIGLESATSGWITTFAIRHSLIPENLALLAPSCFWLFLLIGRATAPALLRFASAERLVLFGLLGAVAGTVVLLNAAQPLGFSFGVALAGLGYATVFPTTLANLTRQLGDLNPGANSVIFAFGGLGGAAIPWLVGTLATSVGDLHVGLLVVFVGVSALTALQCVILLRSKAI